MEILEGIVQRITFHNPENGWTVLKLQPFGNHGKVESVVVHQQKVFAGATLQCHGEWIEHSQYGTQFKANKVIEQKPATASALEKYLGSGLIFGVGPVTAKRIVKHFKDKTLDIFESDIERLKEVSGIANTKLDQIKSSWVEHRSIRNVMIFLQEHGVSTLYAVKIFKKYEDEAISIVKNNPYQLAKDIYGIGFFSADKIALNLGFSKDSSERIGAAIKHLLDSSREFGHCYLIYEQIRDGIYKLIEISDENKILSELESMEKEQLIKTRIIAKEEVQIKCFYAKSLFYDELNLSQRIKNKKIEIPVDQSRIDDWLTRYNKTQKFPLSDEQEKAISQIVSKGFSVLTGGPGCGKTTTTKTMVRLLIAMKKNVLLAAPTGRAAQRMSEVIGLEAKTIHRLLVWDPSTGRFKKNEEDTLDCDFIIVDECSMMDISLSASLMAAISPKTQVLFIGDKDQLPSVGAGNVLKDVIESNGIACYTLNKIFRQGAESDIIRFAHEINKGKVPKITSPLHSPNAWKEDIDCLFLDSEEATKDQAKFIYKIQKVLKKDLENEESTTVLKESEGKYQRLSKNEQEYFVDELSEEEISELRNTGRKGFTLNIPDKFKNTDISTILQADKEAEALKQLLGKVHPWSSLHYGYTAIDMLLHLYTNTIPKEMGTDKEIQILSPMTRGSLGTKNLNKVIQEKINPQTQMNPSIVIADRNFRKRDRVIQKKNNYDLEVFNGDIGKISELDMDTGSILVNFGTKDNPREVVYKKENLLELDLAYAITIHKSQGSEFDVVILPVATQHFNMLYRNLIYTGLTRAKKLALFIGSRKAMFLSVKNVDSTNRQTYLKELLQEV